MSGSRLHTGSPHARGDSQFRCAHHARPGRSSSIVRESSLRRTWNENSLRLKVGPPAEYAGPSHLVASLSSREKVTVRTLREAVQRMRRYIETHGLASSEWSGGRVTDPAGKDVARVSYNGRVWKNPNDLGSEITNLDWPNA